MSASDFLDRVFPHVGELSTSRFSFKAWRHAGRPTNEGVGRLPGVTVDVDAFASRVMDIGQYRGNIDYVEESRAVDGPEHSPPQAVRFYQRIKVPVLGAIQMELVLTDFGERDGYRVLAWHQQDAATRALNPRKGARTDYNLGAWLIRPDAVAYALSSAPRRDDVGRLKFAALTKGADAGAANMVKANIEGMIAWSKR
jgi:hypothetical protein